MRSMEMSAKTVEAAVQAACEALGVDRDDINVSYEVLEFPTRKLIKTIPAKVLVKVEEPEAAPAPAAEEKPAEVSTKPAEVVEISDETAPEIEKAVVEDMVEAAELVEIFQWLRPEQAADIAADAARQQHVGEEIADVLVYLLQIADRCGIDVEAAVERKIGLNALKYPVPTSPQPAPTDSGVADAPSPESRAD